jgi:arsenite methyltransferase
MKPLSFDVEAEVLARYQAGAKTVEPSLCCPTAYDADYLALIPAEIQAKDYGCGDPSRYVQSGETVLDLGSGAGKICYILSQKVGSLGQVFGVDFNDEMLSLARKYQPEMAEKLGYDNVRFLKGKIQDLATNLEAPGEVLIPDSSIDVVVSNCVLNLVRPEDKAQLFQEIWRVLKPGGRAVIADIVCDTAPTDAIRSDPELWSGCIAGAFQAEDFLGAFTQAGFERVEILERREEPWRVVDGVVFRSMTVRADKNPALKQACCG